RVAPLGGSTFLTPVPSFSPLGHRQLVLRVSPLTNLRAPQIIGTRLTRRCSEAPLSRIPLHPLTHPSPLGLPPQRPPRFPVVRWYRLASWARTVATRRPPPSRFRVGAVLERPRLPSWRRPRGPALPRRIPGWAIRPLPPSQSRAVGGRALRPRRPSWAAASRRWWSATVGPAIPRFPRLPSRFRAGAALAP